jgi:hypothetical protein
VSPNEPGSCRSQTDYHYCEGKCSEHDPERIEAVVEDVQVNAREHQRG